MTEVGPVSYPCPRRPDVLHVIESAFLPEVIPTDVTKQSDGVTTGELVLTTLRRTASPLLRYRTGDLVRMTIALAHLLHGPQGMFARTWLTSTNVAVICILLTVYLLLFY